MTDNQPEVLPEDEVIEWNEDKGVFDYSSLNVPSKDQTYLIGVEQKIIFHRNQSIMNLGEWLQEAQEKIPHGEYKKWVEGALPFSWTTAKNAVRVFKRFKRAKSALLKKLKSSSLVHLSSKSEVVQDHVLRVASTSDSPLSIKQVEEITNKLENRSMEEMISDVHDNPEFYDTPIEKEANKKPIVQSRPEQTMKRMKSLRKQYSNLVNDIISDQTKFTFSDLDLIADTICSIISNTDFVLSNITPDTYQNMNGKNESRLINLKVLLSERGKVNVADDMKRNRALFGNTDHDKNDLPPESKTIENQNNHSDQKTTHGDDKDGDSRDDIDDLSGNMENGQNCHIQADESGLSTNTSNIDNDSKKAVKTPLAENEHLILKSITKPKTKKQIEKEKRLKKIDNVIRQNHEGFDGEKNSREVIKDLNERKLFKAKAKWNEPNFSVYLKELKQRVQTEEI